MKSLFSQFQKKWVGRSLTGPSGIVAPGPLKLPAMPGTFSGPAYKQDLRFLNGKR